MCDDQEKSDEVMSGLNKVQGNIQQGIIDTITDDVLPPDFKLKFEEFLLSIENPLEQQNMVEGNKNEWSRTFYDLTRRAIIKESYTNLMEGFSNIGSKFSRKAFCAAFVARQGDDPDVNRIEIETHIDNIINDLSFTNLQETLLYKYRQEFNTFFEYYKRSFDYAESIRKIIRNKINELEKLNNKLDTYKQNLYIDSRKDKYENSNYDFYKYINFYILLVYYLLIISYFIFTPFFREKKYTNFKLVTFIIFYIVFPFILPYILSLIYLGYEYIMEINNLKGEIISYPYIIEEREKYE